MSESFAELFEQSLNQQNMQAGTIVPATVVDVTPDVVIVDAGLKSEAFIPTDEFRTLSGDLDVEVGQVVEVALDAIEDGFGETKLSRERARRLQAWGNLQKSLDDNETINGVITGRVKGGFTVDVGMLRAFLPGSLVDVRPVRDPGFMEGQEIEFKVIKLDQARNNVVVSRRAVMEEEYSAEREQLLETLEEGASVKGVIKNLTDYGAFVDMGGIDGLLHITDMAWKRVRHPSEVVEIGQEIEVKVLKFDRERQRVSLGLKQMGEDPWAALAARYPVGARLQGKVTNITDYGCFVEIEDGVEGLVHVSEMDWTNRNPNPAKVVHVGEEREVMVLDIDEERRRISLGMKQCQANPWEAFGLTHKKGDRVKGAIKSITDFGIFIGLDGGIDGLVHMSDISWDDETENAVRGYSKGQEVEAIILAIDGERERISLGIKQMDQDPFATWLVANPKGSLVTGKVIEIDNRIATLEMTEGVEGVLRASEAAQERVEDLRTLFNMGDEVEARFVGMDRKSRTISLSIKAKEAYEEQEAMEEYKSGEADASSAATLGDLLKGQMDK